MYNVSFPGFGWEFTINPVAFQIGNYSRNGSRNAVCL